ncbi:MAG: hypothetical protein E3J56_12700 [Candidatus Aminicenantes bacterium]|nr:MAG: hypothetical protein E3J56_12700 [Candidatus Aminicenantes bacterium]
MGSKKILKNLIEKILNFGEKINHIKFRPYQRKRAEDLTRAIILHESGTYTTLWSRKSGKSEMLKGLMLSLLAVLPGLARTHLRHEFPRLKLFKYGLSVAFAGPKLDLARIPFVRLKRQARQKAFIDELEKFNLSVVVSNSSNFELSNGSVATAFSGSETASNEGPSAHVLLLDECALLTPFSIYKILFPMVAHVDGVISETGTPSRKRCPFLTDIEYNQRKFPKMHDEVPYTGVIPFSKYYASYIDKQIDRLPGGLKNPFFRMNFLLEWLIAEGHFIDPKLFIKLAKGTRGPTGGKLAAGVDWGKVSSATTVTILEDRNGQAVVVDLLEIRGNWDHQFSYIVPFLNEYTLEKIFSESVGIGDYPTEHLAKEIPGNKVEGKFMSAPYKDLIFTNLQDDIIAKPSRFNYFEDDSEECKSFIRQFLDGEQEIKGKLLSVHKPDEEGSADDFLISTALARDALYSTPTTKIEGQGTGVKRNVLAVLDDY